jgi:zinc/manganese transport system permease protein
VLIEYYSFTWPPSHDGWPVSFFIVALVFVAFLIAEPLGRRRIRQVEG